MGFVSCSYIEGAEWTGTSKRAFVTISAQIFFGVGLLVMSGVAYFIRDWRILHLVFSSPLLLVILAVYWSVTPSVLQCNPKLIVAYYSATMKAKVQFCILLFACMLLCK